MPSLTCSQRFWNMSFSFCVIIFHCLLHSTMRSVLGTSFMFTISSAQYREYPLLRNRQNADGVRLHPLGPVKGTVHASAHGHTFMFHARSPDLQHRTSDLTMLFWKNGHKFPQTLLNLWKSFQRSRADIMLHSRSAVRRSGDVT